jgi:predicted DNA-binding protein (MmcQ/YjbR family)
MATRAKRGRVTTTWDQVRAFALDLPSSWEDFPWGETVAKVAKKVFVFLGSEDADAPSMSVKLTDSHQHALSVRDAVPTGYGLGKAGWVTVPLGGADVELLCDWVEESYRNVAPKKLVAQLDALGDPS